MWQNLPDYIWRYSDWHCVWIICRCKHNSYNVQNSAHTTSSSRFDLWSLRCHSVFAKNPRTMRSHSSLLCSLIHRGQLTEVAFTVTSNETAANSFSRLFCLLLTEKRRKWPLPWQRKEKIGHAVVIFLPTACLPCWQPTADLPQQQISHSSFC